MKSVTQEWNYNTTNRFSMDGGHVTLISWEFNTRTTMYNYVLDRKIPQASVVFYVLGYYVSSKK